MNKSKCSACGVAWDKHDGIAVTCRKLERARSALKVIQTWAEFDNGDCLTPNHTSKLCRKALKESE